MSKGCSSSSESLIFSLYLPPQILIRLVQHHQAHMAKRVAFGIPKKMVRTLLLSEVLLCAQIKRMAKRWAIPLFFLQNQAILL